MLWCRLCAIFIAATSVTTSALTPPGIALDPVRPVLIDGIEFSLSWTYSFASDTAYEEGLRLYTKVIWINHGEEVLLGANNISLFDEDGALVTSNSISDLKIDSRGNEHVTVIHSFSLDFEETAEDSATVWLVAGGLTLLAPIVVIIVAAATREVLYALYFGILTAAFVIEKYNLFTAWLRVLDKYLPESLGDVDHAFVILFTWFLSGLIATITKSGGAFGIAEVFRKFAKSKTSTQAIIFILGFVIFFDDYANSLILGNTMRIVSDEHWISREKLCFIVDATTAPVASIAPISSWIGFEVGLIQEQLDNLEAAGEDLTGLESSAYLIFLQTIKSRFYPIVMLFFQIFLIIARREFGPMMRAERRCQDQHKLIADDAKIKDDEDDQTLAPDKDTPVRWWNGVIPVVMVVVLVLLGIILTGWQETKDNGDEMNIENVFGNGDSYASLMYGSFFTAVFCWFLYWAQNVDAGTILFPLCWWIKCQKAPGHPLMRFQKSLDTFLDGIKMVLGPVMVLIMAWAIGAAITDSGCDMFFASVLGDNLDPKAYPVLTFIIAALISFCTGTSWGTMSILFPLIVPVAWTCCYDPDLFYLTISAILSGAVFGDHCTPISDTTILSAIASRCDVMHHTITQLPYAVIVGFIAIVLGYLPVGYDAYASGPGILLGFLASMIIILFIGVRVDHPKRKLDIFNICYYKIKSFFPEKEPSTDEEAEALEKPENFYVYDEEYDREYVDIFRPKFWKMSTWRKKSTPTTGVDGAAAVVAEADAAADQKSAARAVVEED